MRTRSARGASVGRPGAVALLAAGCSGPADQVLTVSTSLQQITRKIEDELSMPPGAGLLALLEKRDLQDPPLEAPCR